jgi:hypothetical protein
MNLLCGAQLGSNTPGQLQQQSADASRQALLHNGFKPGDLLLGWRFQGLCFARFVFSALKPILKR